MIVCQCGWRTFGDASATIKCFKCGAKLVAAKPRTERDPEWPRWAKLIRMLRTKADAGIGDTAQRIAAKFGGERFKALSKRIGMPCACTGRQEEWNRLYPYD